jgi:type IV pilus assembly protein PilB
MADPSNIFAIDDMKMKTQLQVRAVMVPPSQMVALKRGGSSVDSLSPDAEEASDVDSQVMEMLEEFAIKDFSEGETKRGFLGMGGKKESTAVKAEHDDGTTDLTPAQAAKSDTVAGDAEAAGEAPIIRIVNAVLMYAIRDGASDIHIEPQTKGVRIRYRIDGVLHEQMQVPPHILGPLISRIKIMADMNIAERRIPQDGRIKLKLQEKEFDMRVNTCPTAWARSASCASSTKARSCSAWTSLACTPSCRPSCWSCAYSPTAWSWCAGRPGRARRLRSTRSSTPSTRSRRTS